MEDISFASYVFWMGVGASGAGLYFWIEGKERRRAGVAATIFGALSALLTVKEVKIMISGIPLANFIGPAILFFTWALLGYDIYLRKRRVEQPSAPQEIAKLTDEIERLKKSSEPWIATFDTGAGYDLESAWYGAPHHTAIDVTPQVKDLIRSGRRSIPVSYRVLLGYDPAPDVLKSLKLAFSIVRSDAKEMFIPPAVPEDQLTRADSQREIQQLTEQLNTLQLKIRSPFPYLTVEREVAEVFDAPTVTYKNKIRVVLTNSSADEIQVWTPVWDEASSEVKCQWPLGTSLQTAGPRGWLKDDWLEEQSCLRVAPNSVFRCWIGLTPPVGESIERRIPQQKNGTLIFPIKAGNKLFEARVKI
jgi:hypothetical protein